MPGPPNNQSDPKVPGLQYPTLTTPDIQLRDTMKNVFDNLFWIRRALNEPRPLSPQQLRSLEQKLINQVIDNIVNNNTFNLTGIFITGTHNLRITTYGAAGQDIGTAFFETDRHVIYIITDGPKKWQFAAGVMMDTIANRPADLGANDASYLFFGTDDEALYIWDGTQWLQVSTNVELAGFWEPVSGGTESNPELIFDDDGRCVMVWVGTP